MVLISGVEQGSVAYKSGIKKGDKLCEINKHPIRDVLDYRFYMTESDLSLLIIRDGKQIEIKIKKEQYEDPGLEFDTYLMDKKRRCANKCVFCFIDQNPKGMRESIYFKDDDSRLSFLFGNYITLTNLNQSEIQRIIDMRISPVNVSVHTVNPDLRVKMMNNPFAGKALSYIDSLYEGQIPMNFQIVLCKNLNDKQELENSLRKLSSYYPYTQSIAVVPSGLTKHREGLYPLESFSAQDSEYVLNQIETIAKENLEKYGKRLVYASDEWFLKAKKDIPDAGYYEEYPQIENGVGMLRSMTEEVNDEIAFLTHDKFKPENRFVSVITGKAAYPTIKNYVDKITQVWDNIRVNVICAENKFFGPSITVSGLLTGGDLVCAAKGEDLGSCVYISRCMLKSDEDVFLDNMTLKELSEALGVPVIPIDNDGFCFTDAILGIE